MSKLRKHNRLLDRFTGGKDDGSDAELLEAEESRRDAPEERTQETEDKRAGRPSRRRSGPSVTILPADIVKIVFAVVIIVLIVGKFSVNRKSKATFDSVQKDVAKCVEKDDTMLDGDKNMVKRLYGLDPGEYEGVMLKYPSTNMNVDEVFLVKLKNLAQQDSVTAAIEKRLETQKNNFDGYGTNQYSILEKSVIDVRGNYIMFVVAEKTDPIVKTFEESIR